MEKQTYKLEPLKIWRKAKELRMQYYKEFNEAGEKGGIRYAGSAMDFYALPAGLGRDVYNLTGEPYGATCAYNEPFAIAAQEACDKAGVARDLCGYLRNYWGSILLDKYVDVDGTVVDHWVKPDFLFTQHVCCTHAKWYQRAGELEGGVPFYAFDIGTFGLNELRGKAFQRSLDYVVAQVNDSIEWMQKVTGRKYDYELFCEAAENEIASKALWAQIGALNRAVPAPLDEKTMYSLYVFDTLCPQWTTTVDFFKELKEEVQDRIDRGIGSIYPEKFRLITDSQPPWAFLDIFRFLEREYGAVSVGSLYIFLFASWDVGDDYTLNPGKTLKERGIDLRSLSKEDAVKTYVEQILRGFSGGAMFNVHIRSLLLKQICKEWKAEAVIMHLNRGCEGTAVGQMQNKLFLTEAGIPVFTFEGNMGDPRDFDKAKTITKMETFMDSIGVKKIT